MTITEHDVLAVLGELGFSQTAEERAFAEAQWRKYLRAKVLLC